MRKGFKVAMVCADTYRAGAFEQLKQNATRIRCAFYGKPDENDPVSISDEGVSIFTKQNYEVILVDTSGRHKQSADLFAEMKNVYKAVNPDEVVFVMDSSIGQSCFDQAKAFKDAVGIGSVIITKLDGHAKGGGAISAVAATGAPISFIGTGEAFEKFEKFDSQSFISRLLGKGDLKGLIMTVSEAVDKEKTKEMVENVMQGKFTFKDMREQYMSVMKMGSFSQLTSMIPGLNNLPMDDAQTSKQLQKFLYVMDSFSEKEMNAENVKFEDKRVLSLAIGSGTSIDTVRKLLEQYGVMKKTLSGMKNIKMNKKGDFSEFQRNPNQVLGQLQKCMDPKLVQQIGGMDTFKNLLNNFKGMENNPEMKEAMKMFQNGQTIKKKRK